MYVAPSIDLTAFSCPHCGAYTSQTWWGLSGKKLDKGSLPFVVDQIYYDNYDYRKIEDVEQRDRVKKFLTRKLKKNLFFGDDHGYQSASLNNINISECYNCSELSLWKCEELLFPKASMAPFPSGDMPDDVAADYREAAQIVDVSPRGAAALLRLAIQKLCIHLGCEGKNINKDIGDLVKRGLDQRVQQALDVVRVIGNNAVHPGELDISDDRGTALGIFKLVNLIVDRMITEPREINEVYASLPDGALKAIEVRDEVAKTT